jgi:geranylgeranyl diphosphate synthase type I
MVLRDGAFPFGGAVEIFSQIIRDFSRLPGIESWQTMQDLFQQAASRKPQHWLIPVHACEAVGGSPEQAIPAVLAVGCAHVGILLVDDMLDDDPRGEFRRLGMPMSANLACAFQAAALHAAGQCASEPVSQLAVLRGFNEIFLSTAFGQFLDVQAPKDEPAYWQVAQMKSAPFFGAAFHVGALAGGGPLKTLEQWKRLGHIYGEIIQIYDDIHDVMETPASPDWIQGRTPLPILFARIVEHPQRDDFLALCRHIHSSMALQEAQDILIRCGAVSYCVDQILRRYQAAQAVSDELALPSKGTLDALLHDLIAPVQRLFESPSLQPHAYKSALES